MKITPKAPKPKILLLPLIGMLLFVILYILAALDYPGGSWLMPDQNGFSFWNNYLCDLLDENAINGEFNPARYYAIASLTLLCFSLALLWYYLPNLFSGENFNQNIMWLSGIVSLIVTAFLSSGTHDVTVRIAGVFGVIAFITCFMELYMEKYFKLVIYGGICLLIFLTNYYIYETGIFLNALPVIQKITFISCIIWFVSLDLAFYKKLLTDHANK
ncbi:hypothetical protein [Maribacter sp. HTCC2170]|uniref:hypothetical protein n=1 Tax=Maribacter sp. (strain HTCC2170 / KCCM 42371) TaxID=313603 RepID=UPI00006B2145|nr:hypothetical protein [Maribacter sp. HTCC2170]EAR00087.1 hypothetical protein FB2170_00435 [Maribacter sp. HTCC2170]